MGEEFSEKPKELTASDFRDRLADVVRPLASKEKKTRAENIALTHMETAMLWLQAQAQADKI